MEHIPLIKVVDVTKGVICFTCDNCLWIDWASNYSDAINGIGCAVFWYTWHVPQCLPDCLDYTHNGVGLL